MHYRFKTGDTVRLQGIEALAPVGIVTAVDADSNAVLILDDNGCEYFVDTKYLHKLYT